MVEQELTQSAEKQHRRRRIVRIAWLTLILFLVFSFGIRFILQRPRSLYWSSTKYSLSLESLVPGNPFSDEKLWIHLDWDGPTGEYTGGQLYGLKLGKRLLRLDITEDPIGAIKRNLPKTVPGLLKAMESKDAFVKMCAGEALVKMGPAAQSAFPDLLKLYQPGDEQMESIILEVAKTAGATTVTPLSTALTDHDPKVRQIASQALGEFGPAAAPAIPNLKVALSDSKPNVVLAAALSLRKIEPHDHGEVTALIKLFASSDPQVRAGAIYGLGEFGEDAAAAVPPLIHILENGDSETAGFAARTLGLIGPPARPAIPRLITLLDGTNPHSLFFTMEALGRFGENAKAAIPKLLELADKKESMWWGAISALSSMGPEATPGLVKVYRDGKHGQHMVARTFVKQWTNAVAAISTLMENLQSEGAGKIARAAWVLGRLGEPARVSIPRLIELTQHTNPQVRIRAAEALWKLDRQTNTVLPVMIAELKDWSKDPHALDGNTQDEHQQSRQQVAAEVLGEIGPAANEAIPLLQMMQRSSYDTQKKPATEALKKIQQQ
jgi:HEAT repeat protein